METTMTTPMVEKFWDNMINIHVVLLGTEGNKPVPMAPLARKEDSAIWFITAAEHDTFQAAKKGKLGTIYLCDPAGKMYGTVDGALSASGDSSKLDELWTSTAAAWFEQGREDPSVRLMRFKPTEAEIWTTDGAAKYLFETIKANMTEDTPDTGEYGIIRF